eukprot:3703960-Prymnesium_polylepis.1
MVCGRVASVQAAREQQAAGGRVAAARLQVAPEADRRAARLRASGEPPSTRAHCPSRAQATRACGIHCLRSPRTPRRVSTQPSAQASSERPTAQRQRPVHAPKGEEWARPRVARVGGTHRRLTSSARPGDSSSPQSAPACPLRARGRARAA